VTAKCKKPNIVELYDYYFISQRSIIFVCGATDQAGVGGVVLKTLDYTVGYKHPVGLL
jgi:hypothetical protein